MKKVLDPYFLLLIVKKKEAEKSLLKKIPIIYWFPAGQGPTDEQYKGAE